MQSLDLAHCYNDLGIIYWNNGNNDLALQYHNNALNIRKRVNEGKTIEVADSYNNMGLIYSSYNYPLANQNFENALELYKELLGENHPKVALSYNNLALVSDNQGIYFKALEHLEKVMTIWENAFDGDHPNKAFTYLSIGRVQQHNQEYDQAIISLEKALKSYHILYGDKHPEIANTYNQLGAVYLVKGDFTEALEYYQKSIYANLFEQEYEDIYSLPKLENYYNADILLFSLQQKSKAFETLHYNKTLKLRDLKAAMACLNLADKLVSKIRKIRLSEKDKLTLSAKASEIYEAGVMLCFAISEVTINPKLYLERAFDFAERSKSSTLLSAIQDTNAKEFSGIPANILEKETQLKNDIAFYERKLAENSGDDQESVLRSRLLSLNNEYNSYVQTLEKDYPKYYNLKFNESNIGLKELQNALDDQTAFITHFITDERSFAFYVTKEKFKAYETARLGMFDNFVAGIRNAIKYDSKEHFIKASSSLFEQLFPAKFPSNIHNLIIVPTGNLATIPFEALLTELPEETVRDYKQLPYLIKKYSIGYDNSATLFAQRKSEIQNYEGDTEDMLLVAPINFSNEYYANLASSLNDLPGSNSEIREIDRLFRSKDHSTTLLTNDKATEVTFKNQQLHKYKYLHFATHGMVNESKPELSRIFLRPTYNDREDGSLYSGEIYNIDINADLVCLSACQTGLGKISKGEGIIGLSRALLYAGAENLIVSLWTVSDASTSELMIDFYNNHLYSDYSKTFSRALRKSKLKLIEDERYSNPYYWAPFVLIGE